MIRFTATILLIFLGSIAVVAQQNPVTFNKTEYDFGHLAPSAVKFEHDFLFRNTADSAATILSVRSVSESLEFIHTRSKVLPGEYGFVKTKLSTETLDGLFHDEVYVTLRVGNEVRSEVLYLRAQISADGTSDVDRQFEDSDIAVSVEVSPEDIETMEGFLGNDELARAEAEIQYLKKQVGLKSDLISKLSSDLYEKQAVEARYKDQLISLEESLQNSSAVEVDTTIMSQLANLNNELSVMRASDSATQAMIKDQELAFARLKYESDSARQYAQNLSATLQEQFKLQAESMEKANQLQSDLRDKRRIEYKQQQQIDSLEQRISMAGVSTNEINKEIKSLKAELAWKKKEQELQSAHAQFQHSKIEVLKESKLELEAKSDSLSSNLASRSAENERLKQNLKETTGRISNYQRQLDSLRTVSQESAQNEEELLALQEQLTSLEEKDAALKQEIASKDQELTSLESQKSKTQKDLKALELATSRQLEETHNLMHRVNSLSKKESEAQIEISGLKKELVKSREELTRKKAIYDTKSRTLNAKLDNAKMSNDIVFQELKSEVNVMQGERDSMRIELQNEVKRSATLRTRIEKLEAEQSLLADAISGNQSGNQYYMVELMQLNEIDQLPFIDGHDLVISQAEKGITISTGRTTSIKEAIDLKKILVDDGFRKAHVVAYRNGKQISLKEAMETASVE